MERRMIILREELWNERNFSNSGNGIWNSKKRCIAQQGVRWSIQAVWNDRAQHRHPESSQRHLGPVVQTCEIHPVGLECPLSVQCAANIRERCELSSAAPFCVSQHGGSERKV